LNKGYGFAGIGRHLIVNALRAGESSRGRRKPLADILQVQETVKGFGQQVAFTEVFAGIILLYSK
jgi:hypothetical protein